MLRFKQFLFEKWSGKISHSTGDDGHMFLKAHDDDGNEIGSLEYKHKPELKRIDVWMIETKPSHQRKGVATALMNSVKDKHPGSTIDWGTKTFDGIKFSRKYEKKN